MGGTGGSLGHVTDPAVLQAVRDAVAPAVGAGQRIVLAVSGGRDSVGMACLVTAARPDLVGVVVHIRHGLRDDADDATAAQACAALLGLQCEVVPVDVVADGTGPENAARTARMAALASAAAAHGAGFVLTGHTADDQAETVLLNIARGAGLGGLAGIPRLRALAPGVTLVRPVLALRRDQVRAAAAASGLPVVDDPSNDDPHQPRAVARSQLLPLLGQLTGGGSDPVAALARLAGHARTEVAALDSVAADLAQRLLRSWAGVVTIPAQEFAALPAGLAVRLAREMAARAGAVAPLSQAGFAAFRAMGNGRTLTLPNGLRASRGGGWYAMAQTAAPLRERPLDVAGVALDEIGLLLRCAQEDHAGWVPPWSPPQAAATIRVANPGAVVVRSRRPGDRIATAGGTKAVADAMIDAGIPSLARSLLPVVADDEGPLWVPGVAVRAGLTGPWCLRFEPLK